MEVLDRDIARRGRNRNWRISLAAAKGGHTPALLIGKATVASRHRRLVGRPAAVPRLAATSQEFACAGGNGRAILFNNEYADDPWLGPAAIWDLTTSERRNLRLGPVY